jgi:NAD-dependent dihydropyrimidine dehydrogenase PreA subunit
MKRTPLNVVIRVTVLIIFVVGCSIVSSKLWGGKPEAVRHPASIDILPGMTVGEFATANGLPEPLAMKFFNLRDRAGLAKPLDDFGPPDRIAAMVKKKSALAAEHATKNWVKIPVKFLLWIVFLTVVFTLSRKGRIGEGTRGRLLFLSVVVFGVVLGADPGPMGTVKDAVFLFATAHAVFPPRMIALCVFLIMVLLANKYICAWGCQAGTLQDVVYRINQAGPARTVLGGRYKPPFVLSNTVRLLFFLAFTGISFAWGIDIIDPVDPFKIFNPLHNGIAGGLFLGGLLISSLFVYRPWCHFFCPFGLVGWIIEKISRVRIIVDYDACIACGKCAEACPTTVMGAILKADKKTIPDCFACDSCRNACPTGAVSFSTGKRTLPPTGHFDKRMKGNDA